MKAFQIKYNQTKDTVFAKTAKDAMHKYAGEYLTSFYPPYENDDGSWTVCNSMISIRIEIKEL